MPEYQIIHGAKVKTPIDMPDDMLKDIITFSTNVLSKMTTKPYQTNIDDILKEIKEHMDEKWEPNWQVIGGRNFGSLVTHEAKRFCYFYINDTAILVYKA